MHSHAVRLARPSQVMLISSVLSFVKGVLDEHRALFATIFYAIFAARCFRLAKFMQFTALPMGMIHLLERAKKTFR